VVSGEDSATNMALHGKAPARVGAHSRFTEDDLRYMARALALAERGLFTTTPNPRVGCVIVGDGRVLGEGWHVRAGLEHAEVAALADARDKGHDVRGATVYVTLMPCASFGRTPPCVDALVRAQVARVVCAMRDPNADQRASEARLREADIVVDIGLLEREAEALNVGFVSRMRRGTPWVRSKIAASLDGRTALASGESRWITSAAARADGHAWRARACAVLTGIGTVLQDDPALDVREVPTTRQPLRIVIDRHGDTPPAARVLAGGNALVVTAGGRNPAWPQNVEVLDLPDADGRIALAALMRELAQRGLNEIHVETGANINGALLSAGLVDELVVYLAPSVIGTPARGMFEFPAPIEALAERVTLEFTSVDRIGPDLRIVARVRRANDASEAPQTTR